MTNRNIVTRLFDHAAENPDKAALIVGSSRRFFHNPAEKIISYRKISLDTIRTAHSLKARGFKKGDRILIFIPMSYSLYVTILAILYIGAEVVFIDAWANRKRLTDCCRVVRPKGFIGSPIAQVLRLEPEIRRIPIKLMDCRVVSCKNGDEESDFYAYPEAVNDEDTAIITLTTGTTGLPKGAGRSHGLLWNQFSILSDHLKLEKTDVDMTVIPIYVLHSLGLGVTSVLPLVSPTKPTAFNPQLIVKQILKHNVTTSLGSPAFYEKLSDYVLENNIVLPVKRIFIGGAPIFRDLAQKLIDAFPATKIEVIYGCTEVLPISGIPLRDTLRYDPEYGLPVGKKVSGIEVDVVKPYDGPIVFDKGESLSDFLAPPGEAGEIIVKGSHVLQRYLGDPEISRRNKINSGDEEWHRTGDAGRVDPEGNIFILGRIARRFFSNGSYRYPIPYEQRLRTIPEVAFSAVLEHQGIIYAVIELKKKSTCNQGDLPAHIREMLEDINPHRCLFLKEIPRDPRHNSKIDYEKLVKLLPN
ncbi:MAG: AMP-binding protein [Syntrophobacteraceae bacterium]